MKGRTKPKGRQFLGGRFGFWNLRPVCGILVFVVPVVLPILWSLLHSTIQHGPGVQVISRDVYVEEHGSLPLDLEIQNRSSDDLILVGFTCRFTCDAQLVSEELPKLIRAGNTVRLSAQLRIDGRWLCPNTRSAQRRTASVQAVYRIGDSPLLVGPETKAEVSFKRGVWVERSAILSGPRDANRYTHREFATCWIADPTICSFA